MSLHRMGALLGAYTLVGLGFTGTILLSQRYLPYAPGPAEPPVAIEAISATPPVVAPTPVDSADNLEVVLDLLHREYLSQVNDRALFQSSFKLLKDYLKTQKIDVKDFPQLSDAKDRATLTREWRNMIADVEKRAKGKFDRQKISYLALKGMLVALNDPYCVVLEPKEYRVFEEHMSGGNFSGIGVMIELDRDHGNQVTISEPIDDGPAAKAGVKSGDVLRKIDGLETKGWDIEKAANKIRGPEGSTVLLTVFRPKEKRELDIPVKREMIHVRSVQSKIVGDHIGYVRVQVFAEETGKEFEEEVAKVREKGARALVLDLRNNGGGYINAALDLCSHFIPDTERVVSVVNPRLNRSEDHLSLGKEMYPWPAVVLVNRFSASASEITAGCLHDHKRAKLIGETTFGKASVQQVKEFQDGGAFKYTVAHYLTPSGKDIHRKGIPVDIAAKQGPNDNEEHDHVLDVAVKTLEQDLKK